MFNFSVKERVLNFDKIKSVMTGSTTGTELEPALPVTC